MKTKTKPTFFGTDSSNEISLFEYGLLVQPYIKDGREDEYFVVYSTTKDDAGYGNLFDTGFITEETVNGYINGNEFPDSNDITTFLAWNGCSKDEWLKYSFVNKLSDLLQFWGYENIMGTSYNPISSIEAEKRYL